MFGKHVLKHLSKIPKSRRNAFVNTSLIRSIQSTSQLCFAITIEEASKLPKDYNEMPNDVIQVMAIDGDSDAKEERLIRNIMSVDGIEWSEAYKVCQTIKQANRSGAGLLKLPYYTGIALSVTAAFASIPLCFDLESVKVFNEALVTQPIPDAEDLETPLEVGIWAWSWMEPPLGQVSFFLLCLQYARSQMQNIKLRPYTEWVKHKRSKRLVGLYPQYSAPILIDFSEDNLLA